jgi:hypothetical protein
MKLVLANLRCCWKPWVVIALGASSLICGPPTRAEESEKVRQAYVRQGWSDEDRERFYFTTQGSQLIPYDWFLALEGEDGKLFRSDENLERLRFIPQKQSDRNPDALPIGFVKDDHPEGVFDTKRAFLGEHFAVPDYPRTNAWLGLTCAACHTARIETPTAVLTIDGAPAMADVESFLELLAKSLEATHQNDERMQRFATRVLADNYNEIEVEALQKSVKAYSTALGQMVERNASPVKYGFARLDAFGAILNEVCATALQVPENRQPADAPASFPFLWETPQLDWVQWNGSASNPLARNVGEALGVFAHFSLVAAEDEDRFKSTVNIQQLFELEQLADKLQAPAWPEEHLGAIDRDNAKLGEQLFVQNCAACHGVRDATGKFPLTDANATGHRFIKTTMVPLDKIGTDNRLALNFLLHTAKPGPLKPYLQPPFADLPEVPRLVLLRSAAKKVIERKLSELQPPPDAAQLGALTGFHGDLQPTEKHLKSYKARPLEGVWATAPFLHNGSVPSLYQLLLPADQRVRTFYIGSLKFDPKQVGFLAGPSEGAFEFQTHDAKGQPIPGNSNWGHSGPWYTQLRTSTGEYRDFTDDERLALIEYLKTGGGVPKDAHALETIPPDEAQQIAEITELTLKLLKQRYGGELPVLRAVHPKDHGCVKAEFQVVEDLPQALRVGVFSQPGRKYPAWIRFSNAAALVGPDITPGLPESARNGSRGMAIKLMGVEGSPLVEGEGPTTQDFLMVNLPVFPFANVSDYLELNRALFEHRDDVVKAFGQFAAKVPPERAQRAAQINGQIRAISLASPLESPYFSAAPFLFGQDRVMKYCVRPLDVTSSATPAKPGPNYLRQATIDHLRAKPARFEFLVQVRPADSDNLAIEDVTVDWKEEEFPFQRVATITIPVQEFDSPESRALCESLFFTPWHGIEDHRPLGGINRLRKSVYLESSRHRHHPKEPAGF